MGRANGPLGRTQRTVGASQRRVRRRFAPPNGPLVRPNGVGRGHDEGPTALGLARRRRGMPPNGVEECPRRRRGVRRGLPNGVGSISRRRCGHSSTPLGSCPRHSQRRRDVVQVTPNAVGSHPQRRLEAVWVSSTPSRVMPTASRVMPTASSLREGRGVVRLYRCLCRAPEVHQPF